MTWLRTPSAVNAGAHILSVICFARQTRRRAFATGIPATDQTIYASPNMRARSPTHPPSNRTGHSGQRHRDGARSLQTGPGRDDRVLSECRIARASAVSTVPSYQSP